ncbi:hypothetical protein [Nostoc sp. JL33]|uniref:hypothetical protein n=1 Tax=Nostoc sp. JL33 TaxID=2815396 RepID=UPI0025E92EE9|nr:hypothetical protein [Nostoc sp. JL33]MBN3873144.1 hypothetical protein [Nostoc sp. JL33]
MSNDKPKKRLRFVFEVFCKAIAYNAIIQSALAQLTGGIALVMGECDRLYIKFYGNIQV